MTKMEIDTAQSKALTYLVILIENDINYTQKISEHLNRHTGPLSIQLRKIERDEYIKKTTEGRKTIYSVNWDKIVSNFFSQLEKKIKENYEYCKAFEVDGKPEETYKVNIQNYQKELKKLKQSQELRKNIAIGYSSFFKILFEQKILQKHGINCLNDMTEVLIKYFGKRKIFKESEHPEMIELCEYCRFASTNRSHEFIEGLIELMNSISTNTTGGV